MPFLAATLLLLLNNGLRLAGREFKNGRPINALLAATLGVFSYVGLREVIDLVSGA